MRALDQCFLLSPKVAICYVYVPNDAKHADWATRFASSYFNNPPGISHDTFIICQGGHPPEETRNMFQTVLPNCELFLHDDSGWDCGAFQHLASESDYLMAFFGGSSFFTRPGWLKRMVDVQRTYGDGLYGAFANRGMPMHDVYPHIRTNGFWMPTWLLAQYPYRVKTQGERYPFEHGKNCLTSWVTRTGYPALEVTFDGVYDQPNWSTDPRGFQRGDQSACLLRDRLLEPPFYT